MPGRGDVDAPTEIGGGTGGAGGDAEAAVATDGVGIVASSGGAGGGSVEGEPCSVNGAPGVCRDVADCGPDSEAVPGFCAGGAGVLCCLPANTAPCVPATKVVPPTNAVLVESPGEGTCPDGMALVEAFCIDRYEAALVKVADGAPWSPYFNPGSVPVRAVSVKGAVPQGYIDQIHAKAACVAAGKRLCTDNEWLRACHGKGNHAYPYGDVLVPGRCNDHRTKHPAAEYFGTSESWIYSELGNACINQLPDSLDLAGANPDCVTDEGVLDMMGNLHEWTADPAGTFRGGYYVDTVKNGPGCLYATTAHDVSHADYSTGFRCCADP